MSKPDIDASLPSNEIGQALVAKYGATTACWAANEYYNEEVLLWICRKYTDKPNWTWISQYRKISEAFIREFKDKVDWMWISRCPKLSEEFIREFQDEVYWAWICEYQDLDFSYEFKRDFGLGY